MRQKRTAVLEGEFDNAIVPEASVQVLRMRGGRRMPGFLAAWAKKAHELQKQAHVFYFAFKHPRTPWHARLIAACAAGYLLSPVQIIPSFIPVVGFMDDFVVLLVGFKLIQKVLPADVLQECRDRADAAEVERQTEPQSFAKAFVFILIAVAWLIVAVVGSWLVASQFRHR